MSAIYDEVEIEDLTFDASLRRFTYPCPCGDLFSLALDEMLNGEDVAGCPSCSLRIRIIFDEDSLRAIVGDL